MKNIMLTFILLIGIVSTNYAVNTPTTNNANLTHFLNIDTKTVTKTNGKKLNTVERFGYKLAQKAVKKAQKAGLLNNIEEAEGKKGGINRGLLATIFGGAGLLLIWLPLVGLGLGITGLVFGILGIVKDGASALNIVGLVLGAIVTLAWLF